MSWGSPNCRPRSTAFPLTFVHHGTNAHGSAARPLTAIDYVLVAVQFLDL